MACCAFAVYLLSQLLFPLHWLRDRLFGVPPAIANVAVTWSPETPIVAESQWPRRWTPALLLLIVAEVAGLGVAARATSMAPSAAQPSVEYLEALHRSLCSAVKETLT